MAHQACSLVKMAMAYISEGVESFAEFQRKLASDLGVSPEDLRAFKLEDVWETAGKRYVKGDGVEGLRQLEREAKVRLAKDAMSLRRSSIVERASAFAKAGMLSGGFFTRTLQANVAGNTAEIVAELVERLPASIADLGASWASGDGKRTLLASKGQWEGIKAMFSKETGSRMLEILQHGAPTDLLAKWDIPREVRGGKFAVDAYFTNVVMRLQGASDVPFRRRAFAQALYERTHLKAAHEVADAAKAGREFDGDAYLKELLESPTEDLVVAATRDSLDAIFMSENWVTRKANQLKAASRGMEDFGPIGKVGSQVVEYALNLLMPFTTVPTNVITKTAERTPLGLLVGIAETGLAVAARRNPQIASWFTEQGWDAMETTRRGTKRIGRGVTGSALIAYGYSLYDMGLINPARSSDKPQRDREETLGQIPSSMVVALPWEETPRNYRLVETVPGMLLALGATIRANELEPRKRPKGLPEVVGDASLGLASDLPSIQGLGSFAELFQDSSSAGRVTASIAKGAMPFSGLVGDVAALGDPHRRANRGFVEGLKERLPGYRQDLAPVYDALGRPTEQRQWWNRFGGTTSRTDPVSEAIRRTKLRISKPNRNTDQESSDFDKTTSDWMDRVHFIGAFVHEDLTGIVSDPDFAKLSLSEQREDLETAYKKARIEALKEYKALIEEGQRPSRTK
jgi:hypothetical protein